MLILTNITLEFDFISKNCKTLLLNQVHFDGMGPTWSRLVDVGIQKYPEATHGILADADYMPLQVSDA
jgi:hypothetical protein